MKNTLFLAGILIAIVFAFPVFAQNADTSEQGRISELQAMIVQLLKIIAELQQQLLAARQPQAPVPFRCGQAEITWGSVSGATDYVLYRNSLEVYSGKDLRFLDKGLASGTEYAYTVRARNAGGLGPASSFQSITTSSQCAPLIPFIWTQEGLVCGGNTQVSWSRVQGASFYEVFRGDARAFSGGVLSFVDRGLTPGQNYKYKVRAGNSGGLGEFSLETSAKASVVCPPPAPKAPTVKDPRLESVAREGIFDIAIQGSPSRATVQSGGSGVDILSFGVSTKLSPIVIERVDVEFSDRPWLFLSVVELRDGDRAVSKIEVSQDTFVQTGDASYLLRFAHFAIKVPEGGGRTISVRVFAKEDLLLAEPREFTVSIPTNSVRGKDEAGVPHEGPSLQKAPEFQKTFFVKRK